MVVPYSLALSSCKTLVEPPVDHLTLSLDRCKLFVRLHFANTRSFEPLLPIKYVDTFANENDVNYIHEIPILVMKGYNINDYIKRYKNQ